MYIGIDLGGTKIRGGLLDRSFKVREVVERATQARGGRQKVLGNIFAVIDSLITRRVKGIGLAARGHIEHEMGIIRESTMMPKGFRNLRLARLVQQKFRVKVKLDNDVHCFTLAEALFGAGRGKKIVVGLTLGTGIGGGIVADGQIRHGAHGAAGELGHMIVRPDSYKWNCGQRGCFESLCSASALMWRYKNKTGRRLSSFDIEGKYHAGQKAAREIFGAMSEDLGLGLANIVQTSDPSIIVIGGGFSKLRFYVDPAIKAYKKYVVYEGLKKTPIKYAKLGPHAGLIGAALLLRKNK